MDTGTQQDVTQQLGGRKGISMPWLTETIMNGRNAANPPDGKLVKPSKETSALCIQPRGRARKDATPALIHFDTA